MTVPGAPPDKREAARRLLTALAAAGEGADVGSSDPWADPYASHVNPRLARMLYGIGIDVAYTRGEGSRLYDDRGRAYLDFAAGYGALPFGHNPPELWQAIDRFRLSGEPNLIQPAALSAAGELARRLAGVAPGGLRYAFLCNSGAEAVEAAVKVARSATGRTLILSTSDGFHGKTLGALSASGRRRYQEPFGAPAQGFGTVPFGSAAALEAHFREHGGATAAFLVEAIQGEGGVRPAPAGYLALARDLCTRYGAKLIVDEVQTGLGRTGMMFACEHEQVTPDIMPLAKALGGGLVPLAAVLYDDGCENADFALRHTSTFGGNAFCARVGLASLDLLTADDGRLVEQVARRGARLRAGLVALAERHQVITDVRGNGLLLGVELSSEPAAYPRQGLFRSLAEQGGLAAFCCGHLLRRHGVRLAPAYFATQVLRIEPPLTVTEADGDVVLEALDRTLDLVTRGDSGQFFSYLTDAPARHRTLPAPADPVRARVGEPRWAFVAHPVDDRSYECFDPALGLPGDRVKRLFDRLGQARGADTGTAMFLGSCRVETEEGTSSYGEVLAVPHDARSLLDLPRREAVAVVQSAVDAAVARGAQVVGLGAYTSIVTANATLLDDRGVPITTGNAFTAAVAVGEVLRAAARSVEVAAARAAVVGAGGSIGRAVALLLAESVSALSLVGNPRRGPDGLSALTAVAEDVVRHLRSRGPSADIGGLARLVSELPGSAEEVAGRLIERGRLATTVDVAEGVRAADLIVAATSAPEPLIGAMDVRAGAIVCDVSQPSNVGTDLSSRADLTVITGGMVRLPGGRDLGVDLGLPAGLTYACAAETMVLAHRSAQSHRTSSAAPVSHGPRLDPDLVRELAVQARRHGFRHDPSTTTSDPGPGSMPATAH